MAVVDRAGASDHNPVGPGYDVRECATTRPLAIDRVAISEVRPGIGIIGIDARQKVSVFARRESGTYCFQETTCDFCSPSGDRHQGYSRKNVGVSNAFSTNRLERGGRCGLGPF